MTLIIVSMLSDTNLRIIVRPTGLEATFLRTVSASDDNNPDCGSRVFLSKLQRKDLLLF